MPNVRACGRSLPLVLVHLALLGTAACSEGPTAGAGRSADELHFLRPALDAPPLAATSVSFYAKRGEDREVAIYYRPRAGSGDSSQFLRFRVPASSLSRRPDGTTVAVGDSVLITITVRDPARFIVGFEPAGLRFSDASPARLQMEFAEANDDVNGDGVIDAHDADATSRLGIWRQEANGQPWYPTGSTVFVDLQELEANVLGFTNYAIAY